MHDRLQPRLIIGWDYVRNWVSFRCIKPGMQINERRTIAHGLLAAAVRPVAYWWPAHHRPHKFSWPACHAALPTRLEIAHWCCTACMPMPPARHTSTPPLTCGSHAAVGAEKREVVHVGPSSPSGLWNWTKMNYWAKKKEYVVENSEKKSIRISENKNETI